MEAKFVDTMEEATHIGYIFFIESKKHGVTWDNPPTEYASPAIVDIINAKKQDWASAQQNEEEAIMHVCARIYHVQKLDLALGINLFFKKKFFYYDEESEKFVTLISEKPQELGKLPSIAEALKDIVKKQNPENN